MTSLVALVLACGGARPSAVEATRAAASGEDGALARCLDLAPEAVDACVYAGVGAASLVEMEATCARLPQGSARGECWFAVAERRLTPEVGPETLDAVVEACARAAPYAVDCARHAWQAVRVAHPEKQEALLARLRVALPSAAAEFVDGAAWMTDQGSRADAERAAKSEQADLLGDIVRTRWTRRAQREPAVRRRLCTGTLEDLAHVTRVDPLFARLAWERGPDGDAAVLEARAAACGADVPSDPGAGYAR